MYTKEMREKDVKIAMAMGWTDIKWQFDPHDGQDTDEEYFGEVPTWYLDAMAPCVPYGIVHMVPLFHCSKMTGAGEAAKATLLHWLAEDGNGPGSQFHDFIEELREIVPGLDMGLIWAYGEPEDPMNLLSAKQVGWSLTFEGLLLVMTATPGQVAEAAIMALKL